MFKNKNEEEEEEEEPSDNYNQKLYGKNKYDEEYYSNYIKQYQDNLSMGAAPSSEGLGGAEAHEVVSTEEILEDTSSTDEVEEEVEEVLEEPHIQEFVNDCSSCKNEEISAKIEEIK